MPNLAIIGSGPSALGFLQGILQKLQEGVLSREEVQDLIISIFEKSSLLGNGLPFNPTMTDPEHLLNTPISENPNESIAKWIRENPEEIHHQFKKIFDQRLEEKFQKRFGKPLDESKYSEFSDKEKALYDHYHQRIWPNFEKRYLDFTKEGNDYHPRLLYGLYSLDLFNKTIEALREYGINFEQHPKTEVTELEKAGKNKYSLKFKKEDEENAKIFDNVVIATGWQSRENRPISNRHLTDLHPYSYLRERIEKIAVEEIEQRKLQGNNNKIINIAIQGVSLSAIDTVKSILMASGDGTFEDSEDGLTFHRFDGNEFDIHIDMVSRSGKTLPISRFDKSYPARYPISEKVNEEIGQIKNHQGKIYLWQIIRAIVNQTKEIYKKEDFLEIDEILGELLEIIDRNEANPSQGNYQEIMENLMLLADSDPIDHLKQNLSIAEENADPRFVIFRSIYRQVNKLVLSCRDKLPSEELAYYDQILLPIHRSYYLHMPEKAGRELLAAHEAGALDIIALKENHTPTIENDKIRLGDKLYDVVVGAMGNAENLSQVNKPLARSIMRNAHDHGFATKKYQLSDDCSEESIIAKFGEKAGRQILSSLTVENDKLVYNRNRFILGENGEMLNTDQEETWPGVLFIADRSTVGLIEDGIKMGIKASDNFVQSLQTHKDPQPISAITLVEPGRSMADSSSTI